MPVQDEDFLLPFRRELLQSFAELEFFGGVKLLAEPAQLAENAGFTKDKRAGRPMFYPA